ncbi:MAG: hypothetical protein ACLFSA_12150, partial [Spirochaetaceae bacterium]
MTHPPFCPNKECGLHLPENAEDSPERWFYVAGYYHTKAFGSVRRFRCRSCGRGFSEQTFRLDYYIKHPIDYRQVFERIISGAGLRSIARNFAVSHQLIANRLSRMARQGLGLQAETLAGLKLCENLAADGFESFV